jgi:hypothetical protein
MLLKTFNAKYMEGKELKGFLAIDSNGLKGVPWKKDFVRRVITFFNVSPLICNKHTKLKAL